MIERVRLRFLASVAWAAVSATFRGPQAMRDFGQRLTHPERTVADALAFVERHERRTTS